MVKSFILALVIFMGCFMLPAPKASAMEPVTIALLAPVALKAGQIAYPYVLKGMMNGAKGFMAMGVDTLNILRLPLGVMQCTVLAPFGGLSSGMKNIGIGAIAPLKLGLHAAMLPLNFFGMPVIANG